MSKSPTELARTLIADLYGKGETELIAQLCTDDYVGHDPMTGVIDRRSLRSDVHAYRRGFPDLRFEILDTVESNEKVSVRWRAAGTHRGEFMGFLPSQRRASFEGITLVRFEQGRIAEAWVHYDALGMMQQLGMAERALPPSAAHREGRPRVEGVPSSRR